MSSIIPLLCIVCPKDPEFSDVSHLLTHVASKGHLSQYNKAKLRAHQDASFREKLQEYDRWYHRHQIERLLSERMVAKDSKDSGGRARAHRTNSRAKASTKEAQPRKRRARSTKASGKERSPVKYEGHIDPQLSRPGQEPNFGRGIESSFLEQPALEADRRRTQAPPSLTATSHRIDLLNQPFPQCSPRAPIPHMSRWQDQGLTPRLGSPRAHPNNEDKPPQVQREDSDGESDYFHTFIRSPTRTTYPDPSEITGLRSGFSVAPPSPGTQADDINRLSQGHDSRDDMLNVAAGDPTPLSPVLRGVRWPGMSIFDSANQEAQRLRNQKKTEDIIEQMEQSSTMVEQMERIYWPNGSLKLQRVITGEVESSPIRELTTPPKPPRRRRPKITKPVLQDISTNAPKRIRKPRGRKALSQESAAQTSHLQAASHEALTSMDPPRFVYPRSAHMGYNPAEDDEYERQLTSGMSNDCRKKRFNVFKDQENNDEGLKEKTHDYTATGYSRAPQNLPQTHAPGLNDCTLAYNAYQLQYTPRFEVPSQLHAEPNQSHLTFSRKNNENIEPILDGDGHIDNETPVFGNERNTQRYFSVTGNQQPQFFSSMPPGMDFGGCVEPVYYGTTVNPLNVYLRQQHFVPSQPQITPFPQVRDEFGRSPLGARGTADAVTRSRY